MSDRFKLLVVGPYPPPFSGPETSIKLLLESPLKEKVDLRLLNINVRRDIASKGRIDLVAIGAFFSILFRLSFAILRYRPIIVYYYVTATRNGWLFKDIWVILLARLFLRKVVIHLRAGHLKSSYNLSPLWCRFLIWFACRQCTAAFVQGHDLRAQFHGLVDNNRIYVVHNMIDVEKFYNYEPSRYEPRRFFFMGHLSFAKGYCDILSVMHDLVRQFPDCKFVFAGYKLQKERNIFCEQVSGNKLNPEDPDECFRKHVTAKCEDNYEYLGPIDEQRKIEEIKKCTAFLLPSYSEGFSMSVLEAMAMSKPVICTPVGALAEVVMDRENGLVIPAGDKKKLKEALVTILSDDNLRTQIVENNRNYVVENFSQSVIADRLFAIFQDIYAKNDLVL